MLRNNKKKKTIVLTAGGTGGHVFPAQAISEILNEDYHLLFITDKRGKQFVKGSLNQIENQVLPTKGFSGSIHNKLYAFSMMIYSLIILTIRFFFKRPDLIIGFGGYPTVPAIIAGYFNRVPIIIHEQNAVIGRANKILAKMACVIALSFKDTIGIPKALNSKIIYTGNPLRKQIVNLMNKSGKRKPGADFRVLIIGGSQGAAIFSKIIPAAISLLPQEIQKRLFVYQQARENLVSDTMKAYQDTKTTVEIKSFFDNIDEMLKNSDLVIARSGAATVIEMIAASKPSVLVPLPSSQNNHQFFNAKFLRDREAAILIEEADLSPEKLSLLLNDLIGDNRKINLMQEKIKEIKIPDATQLLVAVIHRNIK